MNLGIQNRLALVTGSSKNIGRAIAVALAREGARVILTGRDRVALESVRQDLDTNASTHLCIPMDLELESGPEKLVNEIILQSGPPEIIVHNLGGSRSVTDPLASVEDWARVWHYNIGIAHALNRLLIPKMMAAKWGRILHISTLSTQTHDGYPAYVSAKCALDGYVKSISKIASPNNVIINSLAPGMVEIDGRFYSKMKHEDPQRLKSYFENHLPIGRMGTVEEIGNVAAFLCSEHAANMPGAIVRVDGGGY